MLRSRKNVRHQSLQIRDMEFEKMKNLKYLGLKLNVLGDNYKEIQKIINLTYKCFFALKTIFKSKLISVRTRLMLYKVIRPIALQACETRATIKTNEQSLVRSRKRLLW